MCKIKVQTGVSQFDGKGSVVSGDSTVSTRAAEPTSTESPADCTRASKLVRTKPNLRLQIEMWKIL